MPFVTSDKTKSQPAEIYYEDQGMGDPVVLIHGWPLSGRAWEAQVLPLVEAGNRVITYDRRGFGKSTQTWDGYDYDTFTADLAAIIDELDLRDVTLLGFSMGGGEVARYISQYGSDRVKKAVFAAAVPPFLFKSDENPDGGLDDAAIAEFEAGVLKDRPKFLEKFTSDFFTPNGNDFLDKKSGAVSEPQRQYAVAQALVASPKGTLDCIKAFGTTDFRQDVASIHVPTLVIHGDSDAIVPFEVSGQRTAAAIPGAELLVIKDGPHGINVSHVEEFNEALINFIAGPDLTTADLDTGLATSGTATRSATEYQA